MKIKRRGNRKGASHRVSMSFTKSTYEALRKESVKHDYSIAEITRQVIDRSIVYGLLSDEEKPLPAAALGSYAEMQEYVLIASKNRREDAEKIKLLTEFVDLHHKRVTMLEELIESLEGRLLEQAVALATYETDGVTDARRTST